MLRRTAIIVTRIPSILYLLYHILFELYRWYPVRLHVRGTVYEVTLERILVKVVLYAG